MKNRQSLLNEIRGGIEELAKLQAQAKNKAVRTKTTHELKGLLKAIRYYIDELEKLVGKGDIK